jgi:hypothetical protein
MAMFVADNVYNEPEISSGDSDLTQRPAGKGIEALGKTKLCCSDVPHLGKLSADRMKDGLRSH